MSRKSTLILFSALLVALFVAAVPVFAQDTGSLETTPGGNPIVPLEFLEAILLTILTTAGAAAWGLFANAPVTQPIVQIVKYLVVLLPEWPVIKIVRNAPTNHIVMGVSVVMTVIAGAAAYLGFELEFANALDVVRAVAAIIVTLIGTQVGANGIFDFVNQRHVPLLGAARTPHQ